MNHYRVKLTNRETGEIHIINATGYSIESVLVKYQKHFPKMKVLVVRK